jgi:thymidylate synthase
MDRQYTQVLKSALRSSFEKNSEASTAKVVSGWQFVHDMREGFPFSTIVNMSWHDVVVEMLWTLRGEDTVQYLVNNECYVWANVAYKQYEKIAKHEIELNNAMVYHPSYNLTREEFIDKIKTDDEFAKKWGKFQSFHGRQWTDWGGKKEVKLTQERTPEGYLKFEEEIIPGINQIANLVNKLRENPDSLNLVVSSMNAREIEKLKFPVKHCGFQVYTRELSLTERRKQISQTMFEQIYNAGTPDTLSHPEIDQWRVPRYAISLIWNQRHADLIGLPFDVAFYGLLLETIATEVNMLPESLIGNFDECQLQLEDTDQARELLSRDHYKLPKLRIASEFWNPENVLGDRFEAVLIGILPQDFELEGYQNFTSSTNIHKEETL